MDKSLVAAYNLVLCRAHEAGLSYQSTPEDRETARRYHEQRRVELAAQDV